MIFDIWGEIKCPTKQQPIAVNSNTAAMPLKTAKARKRGLVGLERLEIRLSDKPRNFPIHVGPIVIGVSSLSSRSFNVTPSIMEETTRRTPLVTFRDRGKTAKHC